MKVVGLFFVFFFSLIFPQISFAAVPTPGNSQANWYMAGANPQRTSWVSQEVRGGANRASGYSPVWYVPIDPYVDNKVQAIVSNNTIFVSSVKGLYAFDSETGAQKWVYGTEMPLGNSPTVVTVNGQLIVYVGGFDHKIRAINASSGMAVAGYTPFEAGAGFDTNPLFINDSFVQNTIFAGNRDGNFYALDAVTGARKWSFATGGPITYSAAYKNGVVYFASNDSYAYAINAASGTLVWKSDKLPGVGFDMYWPVIYTDTSVTPNKDYVIFTGSLKAGAFWFYGNLDMYHSVNFEIYPNGSGRCPVASGVTYFWPSGTEVLDCSIISNHLAAKPWRRFTFILNANDGKELTNPYAPFNPSPHDGGGQGYRHPVAINELQNVIYTLVGYLGGGNAGATNDIVGWKFGTPYVSRVVDELASGTDGLSDEPRAVTAGGNIVYYGEGHNHQAMGAIDVAKPISQSVWWKWSTNGVNGAAAKYTSISLQGKFGGDNGSYTYFDGVLNLSPIPYNGKLYYIQGNILFAVSATGTATAPLAMAATPSVSNQASAGISTSKTEIKQKLESEVTKIVSAGVLRPGFHDSGGASASMIWPFDGYYIPGLHIAEYFHNPADTVTALLAARPHLSTGLQAQVDTYLQNNYGPGKPYDVSQYVHVGWRGLPKREAFDDTADMTAILDNTTDQDYGFYLKRNKETSYCCFGSPRMFVGAFAPESFYAAWKFAQQYPSSAAPLFNNMKTKLPVPGSGNDMGFANTSDTNSNFAKYPYLLNKYIAGYRGYVELDRMVNGLTSISQSNQYGQYQNLLALKNNTFNENSPFRDADQYINVFNASRNFMFMTPETAGELASSSKGGAARTALLNYPVTEPYFFVSKYNRCISECYSMPLYNSPALFQAKAYIAGEPFSELVKFVDVPAFEKGDLFYIQNLAAALVAPGTSPTPTPTQSPIKDGNANGVGGVDASDLTTILTNYIKTVTTLLDQYPDNKVNAFDFVVVLKRLP